MEHVLFLHFKIAKKNDIKDNFSEIIKSMDNDFRLIPVRTWHLLFAGKIPGKSGLYTLEYWQNPEAEAYLSLYKRVGEPWGWTGRLLLTPQALSEKLASRFNEVWLFKTDHVLRGFFEIDRSVPGKAEVVYLGLLPEMIGKGFGKLILDAAILTATGTQNDRVWLHTCEYDHPRAQEMYLNAGFMIEKETVEEEYYPVDFLESIKNPDK